MDGNNRQYSYDVEALANGDHNPNKHLSTAQLQRLVQLLDGSNVSELEVKRAEEGLRLVLRKAKAQDQSAAGSYQVLTAPLAEEDEEAETAAPVEETRIVTASLVGVFHTWSKPKGRPVVALGDQVKLGQLLGTIQSLNVLTEVESPVAGRITEILVQDGQPVEYGQRLMVITISSEV